MSAAEPSPFSAIVIERTLRGSNSSWSKLLIAAL
jgi:hypothetical protein